MLATAVRVNSHTSHPVCSVYVMVVGLTVDYVVHLSDAYLECGKQARGDRCVVMTHTQLPLALCSWAV